MHAALAGGKICWAVSSTVLIKSKSRTEGTEVLSLSVLRTGLSFLIFVHHFGVNDRAFVLAAVAALGFVRIAGRGAPAALFSRLGFFSSYFVELGGDRLPSFVELVARRFDRRGIIAFEGFFDAVDRAFDFRPVVARDFIRALFEHLLGAVDRVIGLIAGLDSFLQLAIFVRVQFGVLAHPLDFILVEAAAGGDGEFLLFSPAEIFC